MYVIPTQNSDVNEQITMISRSPLFVSVLLIAPLVASAWVQPPLPQSVVSKAAPATRLDAFQVPNKLFGPRNNDDTDYEPYDWTNDRLEYVDTESERPWKIDEIVRDNDYTYEPDLSVNMQPSRLSKWNPFSKRSSREPQPPIDSRAQLSTTDAGTLVIDLPATGVDSSAISSGVFGAIWFSSIVPVTLAGGIATGLFMLPFWLAGGFVAKNALVDPFVGSQLTIGEYAWSLKRSYANKDMKRVEGSTRDLRGAIVECLNVQVNGKLFYEIKLCGNKGTTVFGNGLDPQELEYLAHVINRHLQGFQREEKRDNNVFGFISGGGEES